VTIRIDAEFQALIPPLRPEELAQLEANILAEGIRDPLVTWRGVLIDGHNRYAIAERHGLTYQTVEREFADRDAAMLWIYEHQLGRRNLNDDQRAVIAHAVQQQRSKIARQEQAQGAGQRRAATAVRAADGRLLSSVSHALCDTLDATPSSTPKVDTRAAVAKEFQLSRRKLEQVHTVATRAPEVLEEVRQGRTTLADAVRGIKRAELVERLTAVEAVEAKAAQGVYDVLVIDPPWPMQKIERDVREQQAGFDYPTMTEDELAALELPAADDCHVWVWTTHKFLPMTLRLLESWHLKYVCTFVWHKPGGFQPFGLPQYNCEFAVYARRGSPQFPDTSAFPVCFNAPRGAHSEKPEAFYDVVRRVTFGRRLDMFNRRVIEGFDGWGKEAR
jgi:N6-adenosine-specific RNA methylase IME4